MSSPAVKDTAPRNISADEIQMNTTSTSKMNENKLLDFLRPTLNHQLQQPQRTPEEELQKKKERQKKKNEKFKEKKRNRPDFINRLTRPIYHKYTYKKIRAQMMDDGIYHSHQININEEKKEVTINFKSPALLEEARTKMRVNYFSEKQYYKRW
ncbi:unnamed protein product [Adineta ricciae]|uniref:Uncharacterized protein n=1 Tax=Adineta ricciae TaxID=249248 RepID=A0A815MR96_ADIRI|nr:unnamed protein product [Adineta ricciae]CAF1419704.1 unnamed protein product [Adineta ricciae]